MTPGSTSETHRAAVRLAQLFDGHDVFSERMASDFQNNFVALNESLRSAAVAVLPRPDPSFDDIHHQVQQRMREAFAGQVETKWLSPRKYGQVHRDIYALLHQNLSVYVAAWRIRIVTAQAVHTERRIRELLDFGLQVQASKDDNTSFYRLRSPEINLDFAASFQLRAKARNAKIEKSEKTRIIRVAESHHDLP